jgi:hypothetical protein
MSRFFIWLLFLLAVTNAYAQQPPRKEVDLDLFVQELFQVQDEDINYEDLYEILFQFYRNPLDLNAATREELQSLYILSQQQINALVKHKQITGRLLSLYELQAIPYFDSQTIDRLLPFVTVDELPPTADSRGLWARMKEERNHYFIQRFERVMEERTGFTEAVPGSTGSVPQRYTGDPWKIYGRYRWARPRDFSLGFTYEKDPGERFEWNDTLRRYGFDFWSFHFQLYNQGKWKALALGDYNINFGQGLVFSPGFAAGKGGEAVNTVRRNSLGIRPYTSVLEFNYFRGGAATYSLHKQVEITAFYSRRRASGTLQQDTLEDGSIEGSVSSLLVTGFHRTPSEISRRNSLIQQDFGGNLQMYSKDKTFTLGANYLHTLYERPINRELQLFNQFDFSGRSNPLLSVYASKVYRNFNFFGEAATALEGGKAWVAGLMSSLSSKADIALVARNFERNFYSIYGNAFGERTRNANEQGMYMGIKVKPNRRWTINAYADYFRSPWLAFVTDAPSDGSEHLMRLSWVPLKKVQLYGQVRVETKGRNLLDNNSSIDEVVATRRRNVLLNLDWALDDHITMRSRVQSSDFTQPGIFRKGYALIQDLNFEKGRFTVSTRYAVFQTDDFETRQYVYEKDVLYAFSFPAYFGKGTRYYAMVRYTVSRKLDIWVRWSRSTFRDQLTIGSGLDTINGNTRSDLKVQIRYKFI